jgi:hypothetical protein
VISDLEAKLWLELVEELWIKVVNWNIEREGSEPAINPNLMYKPESLMPTLARILLTGSLPYTIKAANKHLSFLRVLWTTLDPMNKAASLLRPTSISLIIRGGLDIHKINVLFGVPIFLKK